jgi:hypothetical protein
MQAMIAHCGAGISDTQRMACRRIGALEAELVFQEDRIAKIRRQGKEPTASMLKTYSVLSYQQRRLMIDIGWNKALSDKPPSKEPTDLADYIADRARAKQANGHASHQRSGRARGMDHALVTSSRIVHAQPLVLAIIEAGGSLDFEASRRPGEAMMAKRGPPFMIFREKADWPDFMTQEFVRRLRNAFNNHRLGANERGIAFEFSWHQWLSIWLASGHLHERGRRRGQYCMARHGDRGAYAAGNVSIITVEDNARASSLGRPKSLAERRKLSRALKGRPHSAEHRRNLRIALIARAKTPQGREHMQRIRKLALAVTTGKPRNSDTRRKIAASVIAGIIAARRLARQAEGRQ